MTCSDKLLSELFFTLMRFVFCSVPKKSLTGLMDKFAGMPVAGNKRRIKIGANVMRAMRDVLDVMK